MTEKIMNDEQNTDNNADVVWRPSAEEIASANITHFMRMTGISDYRELERKASAEPEWFWERLIAFLGVHFQKPYSQLLDLSRGLAFPAWCVGGTTNLVLNAVDRWVQPGGRSDELALIWEAESGEVRQLTYTQLDAEVGRVAAGLLELGLRDGDVVGIYMPMLPETAIAFMAIAKIGCVALPLFSGFGVAAVAARLRAGDAKAAVTVDATPRRGKAIPMKQVLDEAAADAPLLRHVIVVNRSHTNPVMQQGRDHWFEELGRGLAPPATAELDAEHPVMLLYTSGTTGAPKGTVHTHCGMSVKCGQDSRFHWDLKPGDRVLWISDMGWSGGSRLIASAFLAGATVMLVEGGPDYPDEDRLWRLVERHKITTFGVAPSLVRALRVHGDAPRRYDLMSLRVFVSAAEPWDRESWMWLFQVAGDGRVPIMNFSGGTEMGSIIATNMIFPLKPGAFHGPVLGTGADVVDEKGVSRPVGEWGELVMREPCIGLTRSLWKDDDRYLSSYWAQIPGMYTQGDWASRDAQGFWHLHGRSDDTIKVSGKRTGPAEIEQVVMATGLAKDTAAIGVPDAKTGSAIVVAVIAARGVDLESLPGAIKSAVARQLGSSFRPSRVLVVPDLPRTRNMKVMRRLVRAVLADDPLGDISSLANPESIETLRKVSAVPAT